MSALQRAFVEELKELGRILREKGPRPFLAPLLVAAAGLGGLYWRALLPSAARLQELNAQIQLEQGRAEHAQAFEAARAVLERDYARMPRPEDKDGWLFDTILGSARGQGVMLDSIAAQTVSGNGEAWVLTVPVSAKLDFFKLGRWVASLDSEKPQLMVSKLRVVRARGEPGDGRYQVEMEIEAAVPKAVQKL